MFVPANAHLGAGGRVGVGVGLQQERGGLDVVLLGGDVQRRQADPRPRVVLQQHGHHAVVALLQSHRQRREPVLHDTQPTQSSVDSTLRPFPGRPSVSVTATTRSWPCCRATASGVNPSYTTPQSSVDQRCPWVWLTHGSGRVGSRFFSFWWVGLGWVGSSN